MKVYFSSYNIIQLFTSFKIFLLIHFILIDLFIEIETSVINDNQSILYYTVLYMYIYNIALYMYIIILLKSNLYFERNIYI